MELIGVLNEGRLRRELRRREEALRKAAHAREARALEAAEPKQQSPTADEATPRPPATPYSSSRRNRWECDFCRRSFHGYAQFLNHKCHETG